MATQNKKTNNYSPLRYPGGKSKITPFVQLLIERSQITNPIYVEPFAGGAGIALKLLFDGTVTEIVINDYDKAIYSMWKAILTESKRFIELIKTTPITIEEWKKQKKIYTECNTRYSLELGFATFYLNRTNRSGILKAGPIGGYNQTGNYKIDARFNKKDLVERVKLIASRKKQIHLYNSDVNSFFKSYFPKYEENSFVYFDPPYYNKGKVLYTNFFNHNDHIKISRLISKLDTPWMLTYDNSENIKNLYVNYPGFLFDLTYSVANSGKNSELLYLSPMIPFNLEDINELQTKINLRKL